MTKTKTEHVCGLQGYDPMIDPPCPGCLERNPAMSQHNLHDADFATIHALIDLGRFDSACDCLRLIAEKSLGRGDTRTLFEYWDKLRERSQIARAVLGDPKTADGWRDKISRAMTEHNPKAAHGWNEGVDAMEKAEENKICAEAQAKKAVKRTPAGLHVDIVYDPRINRTVFDLYNGVIVELTNTALSRYSVHKDDHATAIVDKLALAVLDAKHGGPTTAGKGTS